MRDFPDLGLSHCAERCERATKLRLAQAEQKIRLILARIDPFAKNRAIGVMFNNSVVAGRDVIAAERFGLTPKIAKFEFLVAHHARIRRAAGLILAREIINDRALELV